MEAMRGWTVLWSAERFRRRALLPTILMASIVVLTLTIGVASAMAVVLDTSLASEECICGNVDSSTTDDSSTTVSVPGDPPTTGLTLPNTGSAGLLGTGVGPHLSLVHLSLVLAFLLVAAGSLGVVVERPALTTQPKDSADESMLR